jgi:hypothetical protein
MHDARFSLGLDWLGPADWEIFEQLASTFLAVEFTELRTTASPSGDRGRDAFLFIPESDPSVAIQYSVSEDWRGKINDTVRTIEKEHPDVRVLVYATNQAIGAKADDLVTTLRRKRNIHVDVRDRQWFLERKETSAATEAAAERLATRIVDPALQDKGVIERRTPVLGDREARTAVLYLDLQLRDDAQEKGLTKIAFDGLVRAALRDTDPANRLPRAEIHRRVMEFVPGHEPERLKVLADSALRRLTKTSVRHHRRVDEFCLAYSERQKLLARVAELEDADRALSEELKSLLEEHGARLELELPANLSGVVFRGQRILNTLLLEKGEDFAEAVRTGKYSLISEQHIRDFVIRDIAAHPDREGVGSALTPVLIRTLEDVLLDPRPGLLGHLRCMADAYTLFAFLRETPDVQEIVQRMFAQGDIWLDTTMLLPVFIEQLLDPKERPYTTLMLAAREAGMNMWIIPGVLSEIDHHISNSLKCARPRSGTSWVGTVPYLLAAYTWAGRPRSEFPGWVQGFRGTHRPEDDIADYLHEELGIRVQSLAGEVERADSDVRYAVEEAWRKRHERRRRDDSVGYDPMAAVEALAANDVEQFLGVVQRRRGEVRDIFGYSSWWLTLDQKTRGIDREVEESCNCRLATPVMSPDFLLNYLALGPPRRRLPKETEKHLPLLLDVGRYKFVPEELLDEADQIREEMEGQPKRRVRRRLRDRLDDIKSKPGDIARDAGAGLNADMNQKLQRPKTRSVS